MLHSRGIDPASATAKRQNLATRLASSGLFATVTAEELTGVLADYHYSVSSYHREAIIAFRGDHCDRLLVLLSGAARSEMSSYRGKRFAVAEHKAPCALAPAFLFGRDTTLPVSIVSTADSELVRLPRAAVLQLCRDHEGFLELFLGDISDRLATIAEKLRLSRLATIRERVADYLLDVSELQGTRTIELLHSRQTLSEIMGVTRPALSRVFAELADREVITYDRGNVQILDLDALLDLVPE